MSKSSRSKIKRANRALKRQKNSKKELVKLEKMVEYAKESVAAQGEKKVYTVLGSAVEEPEPEQEEAMTVDGSELTKPVESAVLDVTEELPMGVTLRKSSGNFPVWMHKRAVKRAKSLEKKKAKQKNKTKRTNTRPWRK